MKFFFIVLGFVLFFPVVVDGEEAQVDEKIIQNLDFFMDLEMIKEKEFLEFVEEIEMETEDDEKK